MTTYDAIGQGGSQKSLGLRDWLAGKEPRLGKSERTSMHIPSDFPRRGF